MGLFDGGVPTGNSEFGRSMDVYQAMNRYARKAAQPSMGVMNDYMRPAFEGAYREAQNLDQTPAVRAAQEALRSRTMGNWNRVGMAGSGSAFAQDRAMARDFGSTEAQAQLEARLRKEQALQSLADQSAGRGLQAANMRIQAGSQLAGAHMAMGQNQQQQRAIEDQGKAAMIQGAAGLALAPFTGGASLGMAAGGLGGMLGGGSGGFGKASATPFQALGPVYGAVNRLRGLMGGEGKSYYANAEGPGNFDPTMRGWETGEIAKSHYAPGVSTVPSSNSFAISGSGSTFQPGPDWYQAPDGLWYQRGYGPQTAEKGYAAPQQQFMYPAH